MDMSCQAGCFCLRTQRTGNQQGMYSESSCIRCRGQFQWHNITDRLIQRLTHGNATCLRVERINTGSDCLAWRVNVQSPIPFSTGAVTSLRQQPCCSVFPVCVVFRQHVGRSSNSLTTMPSFFSLPWPQGGNLSRFAKFLSSAIITICLR